MTRELRRGTDRVIAGVCSGFAAYFDTDVQAIRVLWAVLTVCTALIPGAIAYILCWVFIRPQAS